ncbi:hypothetical protein B2A_09629 [mine drainage metagenome]|uniref:Uncharacterized protein n=1 Tax=mine drainage metagenome TaxID=410659 RepID=T1AUH4_9ZZZZ
MLSASKGKDKYRIDYTQDGAAAIKTFEDVKAGILETSFDSRGDVLDQRLIKKEIGIEEAAKSFLTGIEGEVRVKEYSDVKIAKACPKCGSADIERDLEALGDKGAPIVPRYMCKSCGTLSYRLTDKYLERLVYSNKDMFSKEELDSLDRDSSAFMNELKGYIIRIFASKKIVEIK